MPARYRALWSTPGGGSGFTIFHTDQAGDSATALAIANQVRTFFLALLNFIPDDVSIDFDTEVVDIDVAGNLVAVWPIAAPAGLVGASAAVYSRAAGVRFDWDTGQIVNGRRFRGRTYIVPVISSVFDTTGQIVTATQTQMQTIGQNFISNLNAIAGRSLEVWSPTHAQEHDVTGVSVPPDGAILRSRRD